MIMLGLIGSYRNDGKGNGAVRASLDPAEDILTALQGLNINSGVAPGLATADITLVSHNHGRQRRGERGIARAELQAAVKYGRKEPAHPGRDGSERWRFTHKGVVYVTDSTTRHEVTSWRLDGADDAGGPAPSPFAGAGGCTSHAVLIVDHSGSMRKADVHGFATRTAAVYDCITRELIQPQLALSKGATNAANMVVSIIQMGDTARVLAKRCAVDDWLGAFVSGLQNNRAASHGNYLPALDLAVELLKPDAEQAMHFFVIFLSDGAPSDHTERTCEHGVQVWQQDSDDITGRPLVLPNGRPKLQRCGPGANMCRAELRRLVETECCQRIQLLGDLFGRDRLRVHTVAFGPPSEDYSVLQAMAEVLPRGSFQKLGLKAANLSSAFSSLSSSLATLRTDTAAMGVAGVGAARAGLTLRRGVLHEEKPTDSGGGGSGSRGFGGLAGGASSSVDVGDVVSRQAGWHLYYDRDVVSKQRYSLRSREFTDVGLVAGAHGVAIFSRKFAEGAERFAFRCSEVRRAAAGAGGVPTEHALRVGPSLVAKETIFMEQLLNAKFHHGMARVQAEAEHLATIFNGRVGADRNPAWQVHFVETVVYEVLDPHYDSGRAWILAERELEGRWQKWNNNTGAVRATTGDRGILGGGRGQSVAPAAAAAGRGGIGAIAEDDEEEEEEEDEDGGGGSGHAQQLIRRALERQLARLGASSSTAPSAASASSATTITEDDIPQCFSHFTWSITDGALLVCDLQGVWNPYDGYALTDPAMHCGTAAAGGGGGGKARRRGGTDKGDAGIQNFFNTHRRVFLAGRVRAGRPFGPPPSRALWAVLGALFCLLLASPISSSKRQQKRGQAPHSAAAAPPCRPRCLRTQRLLSNSL